MPIPCPITLLCLLRAIAARPSPTLFDAITYLVKEERVSRDYARSSQPATEVYVAGSDTANPAKKIANGLMRGYDYASEDGTLAA